MYKPVNLRTRATVPLLVMVLAFLVIGCDGVEFANVANVNLELPADFLERIHARGLSSLSPDQLVGAVVYDLKSNPGHFYIKKVYLPPGVRLSFRTLNNKKYEAFVCDTMAMSADIADIIDMSLARNQGVSLIVTDVTEVGIPTERAGWNQMLSLAAEPYPAGVNEIYYIYHVVQSVIVKNIYSEIKSNAKAVVGSTLKAEGRVFNSQRANSTECYSGVLAVPLHELIGQNQTPTIPQAFQNQSPAAFAKQHFLLKAKPKFKLDSATVTPP